MESYVCSSNLAAADAATSLEVSMPHQPPFPNCQFGKSKPVLRSFQAGWFGFWSWPHYHEATDSAFCFLCTKAIREKMSSGNANVAFVSDCDNDNYCMARHVFNM